MIDATARPMPRSRRMLLPKVAALVVGAGLVAAAGWYFLGRGDEGGSEARVYSTSPVERRVLRQTIATRGTAAFAPRAALRSAAAGRVTSVFAAPGDIVEPGTALLALNGRPMVAIAGIAPFWRDLEQGDTGPDVLQLEEFLSVEGVEPGILDGVFTSTTAGALEEWQDDHGFPADGTFKANDLMPGTWPARVGRVYPLAGEFVSVGAQLIDTTEEALIVEVTLTPTQRLRVKEGMGVVLEVTANQVAARGVLGAPREAPASGAPGAPQDVSYVASVVLDGPLEVVEGAQLLATVVLSEAPNALVVPLAAIVMNGAGKPAVQVRDAAGQIALVDVTTGASEGAYIEVVSGLQGGETVVIEGSRAP